MEEGKREREVWRADMAHIAGLQGCGGEAAQCNWLSEGEIRGCAQVRYSSTTLVARYTNQRAAWLQHEDASPSNLPILPCSKSLPGHQLDITAHSLLPEESSPYERP
jgi:hypothetical protein